MILDDKKLLMGFFMNKERDLDGEFKAGVGVNPTIENFKIACDMMYTHICEQINIDKRWAFFFSVIYSVVDSVKISRPDLIDDMIRLK